MADAYSQTIKEIALNLGFGLAAIAPAVPDPRDTSFWKNWLSEGRHGEMAYLENPKKASILEWWPEAKSVLMVGLFYQPQGPRPELPAAGRIASYACYPEYQKRMKKTLRETLKKIQQKIPEAQGRMFSDTSPVLERMYARLSGMGWIGKNTMLIDKRQGSFFFLGGLALNLELQADTPELDHCGSCTRCIQACPTEALTPYQMNASRCISYLTIEKRSIEGDPELERKTGNWIFGCDICQEVCPFNKVQKVQEVQKVQRWEPIISNTINLETILNWSEADYKQYFKGTPVLRAKWEGMRRNARIALRNGTLEGGESVG